MYMVTAFDILIHLHMTSNQAGTLTICPTLHTPYLIRQDHGRPSSQSYDILSVSVKRGAIPEQELENRDLEQID